MIGAALSNPPNVSATWAVLAHGAGGLAAVARAELRGARSLLVAMIVIAAALMMVAPLRWSLAVEPTSRAGLLLTLELAAWTALPAATEIFGGGDGRARELAGLPIRGAALGLSRFAAVLAAVAIAFAVLAPVYAVVQAAVPSPALGSARKFEIDAPMVGQLGALTAFAFGSALLLASILRHSVGAVLGSCALAAWIVSDSIYHDGSRTWLGTLSETLFGFPGYAALGAAAIVLSSLALGIQSPRGATSRAPWRRALRAVALPSAVTLLSAVHGHIGRFVPPLRAWDDPGAYVSRFEASPDGRWVAVTLRHRGIGEPRKGTWIVDALNGSVRLADDGINYVRWVIDGKDPHVMWSPNARWLVVGGGLVDPSTGDRIHDSAGEGSGSQREIDWDYIDRDSFEDDSKRFTVRYAGGPLCHYHVRRGFDWPKSQPHRFFFGHPSGEIRELNGRSGEVRATGIHWSGWDTFSVSPTGRALLITRRPERDSPRTHWLVDLETLEQVKVPDLANTTWSWVNGPELAMRWDEDSNGWHNIMDEGHDRGTLLPKNITTPLQGGRWLSVTGRGVVKLHESNGQVWKTLRGTEESNDH